MPVLQGNMVTATIILVIVTIYLFGATTHSNLIDKGTIIPLMQLV